MTIIHKYGKYEATAQTTGSVTTKSFKSLAKAKEWLRMQYGLINLDIEVKQQIDIRVPSNWKTIIQEESEQCSVCGANLWIAPHGGLYCNADHEGNK